MARVEFVKEPGYTYDLFRLFILYFNKESIFQKNSRLDYTHSDAAVLNQLLLDCGPFSEELLPFFYTKENNISFISLYYHSRLLNRASLSYSLLTVLDELLDFDQVLTYAYRYYFEQISDDEIAECKQSPMVVHKLVKDSPYTSEVKNSLYSLFLEPETVIKKLIDELQEKDKLLSRRYQESQEELLELQKNFDLEELLTVFEQMPLNKTDYRTYDQIYVSFSLFSYYLVYEHCNSEGVLIINLGNKYDIALRESLNDKRMPELHLVGNALAEPNRIEILNLLLQKGELTIKDIVQELGFSGTNTYYHLNLMFRANIVKCRSSGKPVYYSINRRGFDEICKQLSKYSTAIDANDQF